MWKIKKIKGKKKAGREGRKEDGVGVVAKLGSKSS